MKVIARSLVVVTDVDLVGADVLGDAAGLAGDHVGGADRVQQLGLAVVDVTHDRDDRRACVQLGVARRTPRRTRGRSVSSSSRSSSSGLTIWTLVAERLAEQLQRLVGARLGRGDHLAELGEHDLDHRRRGWRRSCPRSRTARHHAAAGRPRPCPRGTNAPIVGAVMLSNSCRFARLDLRCLPRGAPGRPNAPPTPAATAATTAAAAGTRHQPARRDRHRGRGHRAPGARRHRRHRPPRGASRQARVDRPRRRARPWAGHPDAAGRRRTGRAAGRTFPGSGAGHRARRPRLGVASRPAGRARRPGRAGARRRDAGPAYRARPGRPPAVEHRVRDGARLAPDAVPRATRRTGPRARDGRTGSTGHCAGSAGRGAAEPGGRTRGVSLGVVNGLLPGAGEPNAARRTGPGRKAGRAGAPARLAPRALPARRERAGTGPAARSGRWERRLTPRPRLGARPGIRSGAPGLGRLGPLEGRRVRGLVGTAAAVAVEGGEPTLTAGAAGTAAPGAGAAAAAGAGAAAAAMGAALETGAVPVGTLAAPVDALPLVCGNASSKLARHGRFDRRGRRLHELAD